MAEQFFPFENIDTTESQFSKWATNFQDTGIKGNPLDTELAVSAEGSTLTVEVAAGQAFIRGHYYINTSTLELPVTSAGVNTRIDLVVVELDPEANTITTKIIAGEPVTSDPVAPALVQTEEGIYQMLLATLTIPNSTLAITSGMLVDDRIFMSNRIGIWTSATRPASPLEYQTIGYNTTDNNHEYWNGSTWVALIPPVITPNFVMDMNSTTNNTVTFDNPKPAGSYSISFGSPEPAYDVYLLGLDGNSVGYSQSGTILASDQFISVVILGVSSTQIITFIYAGVVEDADSAGQAVGAGAYITSFTPTDLPTIDDTAILNGGNFATDVEVYFESGATSLTAKNITRTSATELIVTRPDALSADLDPWNVRVENAGVTEPTGSDAHILVGGATAGASPIWVTSALANAILTEAYSETLVATDPDGGPVTYAVTSGSLPTGLSLNAATGEISGTPTGSSETFTITATDDGGNGNPREFSLGVQKAVGGTVTAIDGFIVHTFETSGTFTAYDSLSAQYIVVAGGGGAGANNSFTLGGAGGAGGYRSSVPAEISGGGAVSESAYSISPGSLNVIVGAPGVGGIGNGNRGSLGGNSSFGVITSNGGGGGGSVTTGPVIQNPTSGGSGGGGPGATTIAGAAGTAGQGFAGGPGSTLAQGQFYGAGGGAGSVAGGVNTLAAGAPVFSSINGTSTPYALGGGVYSPSPNLITKGKGGTNTDAMKFSGSPGVSGTEGIVIVRYAA